jgi:hypothetical protein
MTVQVLERLKSEEFALSAGFLSTAGSLRRFLQRTEEVTAIRESLSQGAITDGTLRSFVSDLMGDFRRGERFAHELALAALGAVLEMRPTEFADEFLHDLSALRLSEMSLCIRVARECLKHRVSLAQNRGTVLNLGPLDGPPAFSVRALARTYGEDLAGAAQVTRAYGGA